MVVIKASLCLNVCYCQHISVCVGYTHITVRGFKLQTVAAVRAALAQYHSRGYDLVRAVLVSRLHNERSVRCVRVNHRFLCIVLMLLKQEAQLSLRDRASVLSVEIW